MLGSPRTGSTWLLNLLRVDPRVVPLDEPQIGSHLGLFAADVMGIHPAGFERAESLLTDVRADDDQYFFSNRYRDQWLPPLRDMLLRRFGAMVQRRDAVLVIKEPAGSQAAGLLLTALPESRLLFLLRDGRDVIDSELAAVQKGGWLAEQFGSDQQLEGAARRDFVEGQAHRWVARTEAVKRAYDGHDPARRLLVRYEDLRREPHRDVKRILDWLQIPVADDVLQAHVDRLVFEALPDELKGEKKFARAAQPGLWRTNLTGDEHAVMHRIMGPLLAELGYDVDD